MSYSEFQMAIALAITRPEIARSLKGGGESGLHGLALTERERDRLRSLVAQPGMALYCSLARANRLEAIAEGFPMTLVVMEPVLTEFLTRLWERHPASGYRLDHEIAWFVAAVEEALRTGELQLPYLLEVFGYERTCWALASSVREATDATPVSAIVEFDHPPDLLLLPLSRLEAPPEDLPTGTYQLEVRLQGGRFTVHDVES